MGPKFFTEKQAMAFVPYYQCTIHDNLDLLTVY